METIEVNFNGKVCSIRLLKKNIGTRMLKELNQVLDECEKKTTAIVISGDEQVFCVGADFDEFTQNGAEDYINDHMPELYYDTFTRLSNGSFVSIMCVSGKVAAGGMIFAGACDIVIASKDAEFSLTELLFGMCPACVYPFLLRRMSRASIDTMALSTLSISAECATKIGLADFCTEDIGRELRSIVQRSVLLSKKAIEAYKQYSASFTDTENIRTKAICENIRMYSDPDVISNIRMYKEDGIFPWQREN